MQRCALSCAVLGYPQATQRKGSLEGPFDLFGLPDGVIISKRFGVEQGEKVRPIDVLKQSQINAAFELYEKVRVHDREVIAAALMMFPKHFEGEVLGMTIDLKSAYPPLPWRRRRWRRRISR